MNRFTNYAKNTTNTAYTENGAKVYATTHDALLDLFANIGSLRTRSEADITQKFANAYREDSALAIKMAFYAGDIREAGLGERRTFNVILKWLAQNHAPVVVANIENIPHFNRWDSLYTLVGTPCEDAMWKFMKSQITADANAITAAQCAGKDCAVTSLIGKWLKSENASSAKTVALARKTRHAFKMDSKTYRKVLTALRKNLDLVETHMSAGDWDKINYSQVPGKAMYNYKQAFSKHDCERFDNYLHELSKPKGERVESVKVNAKTLFPYDLVHQVRGSHYDAMTDAQWESLKECFAGKIKGNVLPIIDTSGSMTSWSSTIEPIDSSMGLGIMLAQLNTGVFHNLLVPFASTARFTELQDSWDLKTCVSKVNDGYCGHTNLEGAYDLVLQTALRSHASEAELPKAFVVITDGEINSYTSWGKGDFIDKMDAKFRAAGYSGAPIMVMWNVESRADKYISTKEKVVFVSGNSPSAYDAVIAALNGKNAYTAMVDVLSNKCYDCVVTAA